MKKEDEMLMHLPKFLADLREFKEIISAEAPKFEKAEFDINNLLDQSFVSSATWGLDIWERIAYISREPNSTIEERRRRIINHLSSNQPATHRLLESVINNHLNDDSVEITFNNESDYKLDIHFNFQEFNWQRMLNEFKLAVPAHLDFTIFPTEELKIKLDGKTSVRFREYHKVKEMYVGMSLTKSVREESL